MSREQHKGIKKLHAPLPLSKKQPFAPRPQLLLTPKVDHTGKNGPTHRSHQDLSQLQQKNSALKERLKLPRGFAGPMQRSKPSQNATVSNEEKAESGDFKSLVKPLILTTSSSKQQQPSGSKTDRGYREVYWSEPDWVKEMKELEKDNGDSKRLTLNLSRIENRTFEDQFSQEIRVLTARSNRHSRSLLSKVQSKIYFPSGFFHE